jgi:hypothetical protein
MDPVTFVVVPGLIGGALVAVLLSRWQRRSARPLLVPRVRHQQVLSTDVINMSSIKVAGIGGLGLVAMAAAVALDVPRIGQTVALGFGLGLIVAAVLIVARRRGGGPMPSSGRGPGAHTVLTIDEPARKTPPQRPRADRLPVLVLPVR